MSGFDASKGSGPDPDGWAFDAWEEGPDGLPLTESQLALQEDLSALADGELDEGRAAMAMLRMESDRHAQAFFEDLQRCAKLHRDFADPERLVARLAVMTGGTPLATDLEHRLASIFYSLGKAYLLAALDPDRLVERAFEAAAPIDRTRLAGRGFVDGVVASGREGDGVTDWGHARSLLNGRLERIEDPLEKAARLLEQAVEVDAEHEEARFYQAFLDAQQGRKLLAHERWRALFDTALKLENRGHAAIQLGRLHQDEGDHRKALLWYRWVVLSGLLEQDPRFWVVRFNLAMTWLAAGDQARCLDYFRLLVDSAPGRESEVAHLASQAPLLQETLQNDPSFAAALLERCPEIFATPRHDS